MRRGVRETTNCTQTSPRGSTGQAYQFRYQREWPACSRPVTQRGHVLTHVQTQAKSTVLGESVMGGFTVLITTELVNVAIEINSPDASCTCSIPIMISNFIAINSILYII